MTVESDTPRKQMLERDIEALARRRFDLVVVGGGIFGACAAWDAVLRGLSVALIERFDFGGQTSANSYKMIHGGMRYMQHGDLVRVRESCRERSALLRIAPHLVQPLPIVVPTYGHGRKGKGLLAAGMWAYDLVTLDRNGGISDPTRRVRWTQTLSRADLLSEFPAVDAADLTGAVVFSDAQMYNPPRLVLSFVRSAAERGVVVANYADAVALLRDGSKVTGVRVRDLENGEHVNVRAKAVLNATGPWAEDLISRWLDKPCERMSAYSRDACFVVRRQFSSRRALAVFAQNQDPDAALSRGARHLFVVPWRDYTLLGVWHKVCADDPDQISVGETELDSYLGEINSAYPGLNLTRQDILIWHAGLLPFGDNEPGAKDLSYGKRSILIDHASLHGLGGLVSLIGIRYTMGRGDAAKAVDVVAKKLDHRVPRPETDRIPVFGGDIDSFEATVAAVHRADPFDLPDSVVRALVHNYGSEWPRVLAYAHAEPELAEVLPGTTVTAAEVVHAVREEMALTLADVVFRRTDLASAGNPGSPALVAVSDLMARELGWRTDQCENEMAKVRARFPSGQAQAA